MASPQEASLPLQPLKIRVNCESPDCGALLEVGVPDEVRITEPAILIIRCQNCKRLLQVAVPRETYTTYATQAHAQQRAALLRQQQQQLAQLQAQQQALMAGANLSSGAMQHPTQQQQATALFFGDLHHMAGLGYVSTAMQAPSSPLWVSPQFNIATTQQQTAQDALPSHDLFGGCAAPPSPLSQLRFGGHSALDAAAAVAGAQHESPISLRSLLMRSGEMAGAAAGVVEDSSAVVTVADAVGLHCVSLDQLGKRSSEEVVGTAQQQQQQWQQQWQQGGDDCKSGAATEGQLRNGSEAEPEENQEGPALNGQTPSKSKRKLQLEEPHEELRGGPAAAETPPPRTRHRQQQQK